MVKDEILKMQTDLQAVKSSEIGKVGRECKHYNSSMSSKEKAGALNRLQSKKAPGLLSSDFNFKVRKFKDSVF